MIIGMSSKYGSAEAPDLSWETARRLPSEEPLVRGMLGLASMSKQKFI